MIEFIHLKNVPIFQQLQLEEALLRTDERNFCIVNQGSSPAIVMGISGNPGALLNLEKLQCSPIPVIQRFSGGGTVVVDEKTLFVTFIFSKKSLQIPAFPESILRWSAELYKETWQIPGFALKENDYVIGEKKCGGNAQYIKKDRWLHHSSFLWDYSEDNMEYLLLPPKRPDYRKDRAHKDFLTRLKGQYSQEELICRLKTGLERALSMNVKPLYIEDLYWDSYLARPHRQTTRLVEI